LYLSAFSFFNVEPKIHRVYLNLRESLGAFNTTTIKIYPCFDLYTVAKHGPAVTVTPVLPPMKPGLLKSLCVFSQNTSLFDFLLSIQKEMLFVPVIFKN
jgi:hypothetical protein